MIFSPVIYSPAIFNAEINSVLPIVILVIISSPIFDNNVLSLGGYEFRPFYKALEYGCDDSTASVGTLEDGKKLPPYKHLSHKYIFLGII